MIKFLLAVSLLLLLPNATTAYANDTDARKGIKWGAVPIVKATSDQGLILGGFARRFDYGSEYQLPFENLLTLQASFATLGPKGIFLSYEKTHLSQLDLRYYLELNGLTDTYHRYYGIGDETSFSKALETSGYNFYNRDGLSLENSARKNIAPGLDLKAGLTFTGFRLAPNSGNTQFGNDFSGNQKSGLFTKILIGVILERRNLEFIPSSGYFASKSFQISPSFLGTEPSWIKTEGDFRYYLSLIDNRWLWLANQVRYTVSSSETPLIEKARLGSSSTLRGLSMNRFTTNYSFTIRTELRSILWRLRLFGLPGKVGAGVFFDHGRAGDTLSRLISTRPHSAVGFSLFSSYFTDDFLGSADFGFSEDGMSFYIGLGHAF